MLKEALVSETKWEIYTKLWVKNQKIATLIKNRFINTWYNIKVKGETSSKNNYNYFNLVTNSQHKKE